MDNKRKHTRFPVSISCVVEWKDHTIKANIVNLSLGGALITQAERVPPKESAVLVTFGEEQDKIGLTGVVTSRVTHAFWDLTLSDQVGYFGVEFQELQPATRSQLVALIGTYFPDREE